MKNRTSMKLTLGIKSFQNANKFSESYVLIVNYCPAIAKVDSYAMQFPI